jgi:ABC-type branched-subunit amino acid transport system permease subunit
VSLGSPDFWAFVGVTAGIYAVFGLGLQLQLGFAGLLNFGFVAFMAVSAYTMAILTVREGWPLWVASLAGVGVAAVFGVLVGLACLRLRTDYFAIATFALAEIVRYVALNASFTGGSNGTIGLLGPENAAEYNTGWQTFQADLQRWLSHATGLTWSLNETMLVTVWTIAVLLILFVQFCVHKPWGRVLRAIREDEDAAAALGKNVFSYKLQALAFGGALGGIAGLLYAFQFGFFGPSDFDPLTTLIAFMVVILGGTARNWGVAVGALVYGVLYATTRFLNFAPFSYVGSAERAYLRLIVVGAVLVGLMAFRPQGIFGRREELILE